MRMSLGLPQSARLREVHWVHPATMGHVQAQVYLQLTYALCLRQILRSLPYHQSVSCLSKGPTVGVKATAPTLGQAAPL